mmetsp:Transcript_6267/g.20042  ORF Transcript_6267/g.20042 Transcript_6267/m.20042 type:complete len:410 (-) Transcript_6267:160-1389(-)
MGQHVGIIVTLASLAVTSGVAYSPEGLQRRLDKAKRPTSWQKRLDKALLDVDKNPQQRIRLLQKVAGDGKKIVSDVRVAAAEVQEKGIGKGHPLLLDLLFPDGTTARSDLEGFVALRKQLPELAKGLAPPTVEQLRAAAPAAPIDPTRVARALADLAGDERKQRELLQEAKNALRSTPKGLETPKYRVLRSWRAGPGALDGVVELRSYPPFTVARKGMGAGFGAVEGRGAGFNALASYLFGDNADGAAMAMTTPVGIDVSGGGAASSMSFVLPRDAARAPPRPNADGGVTLDEVPARLVAVKAFAGVVTDGEVRRQRDALEAAIEADGGTAPVEAGAFSVLQYNAPYAIPWRRRNELAVVVSEVVAEEEAASAGEAAAGDAEAASAGETAGEREGREGVSSWYDAGVRL